MTAADLQALVAEMNLDDASMLVDPIAELTALEAAADECMDPAEREKRREMMAELLIAFAEVELS